MNVIDVSKKCVGCGACVDVCPTKALQLNKNEDGFYVAMPCGDDCVHCQKCIKVCPALENAKKHRLAEFYYGWSVDERTRLHSSSGGAFSLLAEQILSEGGVVFGARYADDFKSVVMSSTEDCDLDQLRRSKYCQSNPDGIYAKANALLHAEKKVMIVGTPCQIAAARNIFGNNKHLLLVDFMCGGVTPSTAFENYISHIERKFNSKVKSINMRDKSLNWSKMKIRIEFENGKIYSSRYQLDPYYHYYCTPDLKNEPCLSCAFTDHKDADITIADFWGYTKANIPNDGKGISLICTYTEKGNRYLNCIKNKMEIHSLDASFAEYAYKEKQHSPEGLLKRERFLKAVRHSSFMEAAKKDRFKYGKIGILAKTLKRKVVGK